MKRYKKYMDGVKASDTLHQRLREMKGQKRKPAAWAKYGSIAAALVLVFGGVSVGMYRSARLSGYIGSLFHEPAYHPEQEAENQPDIAIVVDPSEVDEPSEQALGSYDVASGSGPEAVVAHYILPYIDYGGTGGGEAASQTAADWDIPKEAARRDLTKDEITVLLGGEDAVNTHLDWSKYELTGWGAWYEDGSFWGAYIMGYTGPMDHFEFAVTAGQLPPTCIAYPGSVVQEIRGLTVTAGGHDGKDGCSRRVSFMKDGYGYRFDLSSADTEQAELLASRLVCRIADRGLALWTVDPSVETYTCPDCGQTFAADSMRAHIHSFTGVEGTASTEPYVPHDPVISAEGAYTCPDCGVDIEAGMKHYHAFAGEGAIPEFVPDYDPACEDGVPEQDLKICGLPLYDPKEAADPAHNAPAPRDGSSIDAAGSAVPSAYQSEPPTLRVRCSEGMADGRSGNYEWSYTGAGSGETASAIACGVHPLDFRDAPSLATADGTVALSFSSLPDQVRVDCWPDSEWGNTAAGRQAADAVRGSGGYALALKDGGWIYEISAEWDGQGRASYVFYLIKN